MSDHMEDWADRERRNAQEKHDSMKAIADQELRRAEALAVMSENDRRRSEIALQIEELRLEKISAERLAIQEHNELIREVITNVEQLVIEAQNTNELLRKS